MMKKKKKLFSVFLYLSLVIIGIIVGIAIGHYNNLPLAEEINLMDIATLMVTIFLAVYVPAILDQRLQTEQDSKNILENRITDYQSLLRRINILIQDDEQRPFDSNRTIKNLLDISEHRLHTLASLIKNSGLDSSLNQDISIIKSMNKEHKNLLWDKLESGEQTFHLDTARKILEQEEILYNKLDEATSLLIFKINNAE